jgi:glycogen(starch) synthase
VTAPTRAMLGALEHNYGRVANSRVVPNGRHPRRFHCGRKEAFILSAGRLWDEGKNVSSLAEAAAALPWPVCVAGEAGGNPIRGCRWLGHLSAARLADWFARASIYALPARYEPFGLSALEAALSGCALVLGDIASLREVWDDAAVYVPPEDAQALLEGLRELIANQPMRQQLARRALERARQFSPARMAQQYLMAYSEASGAAQKLCA